MDKPIYSTAAQAAKAADRERLLAELGERHPVTVWLPPGTRLEVICPATGDLTLEAGAEGLALGVTLPGARVGEHQFQAAVAALGAAVQPLTVDGDDGPIQVLWTSPDGQRAVRHDGEPMLLRRGAWGLDFGDVAEKTLQEAVVALGTKDR